MSNKTKKQSLLLLSLISNNASALELSKVVGYGTTGITLASEHDDFVTSKGELRFGVKNISDIAAAGYTMVKQFLTADVKFDKDGIANKEFIVLYTFMNKSATQKDGNPIIGDNVYSLQSADTKPIKLDDVFTGGNGRFSNFTITLEKGKTNSILIKHSTTGDILEALHSKSDFVAEQPMFDHTGKTVNIADAALKQWALAGLRQSLVNVAGGPSAEGWYSIGTPAVLPTALSKFNTTTVSTLLNEAIADIKGNANNSAAIAAVIEKNIQLDTSWFNIDTLGQVALNKTVLAEAFAATGKNIADGYYGDDNILGNADLSKQYTITGRLHNAGIKFDNATVAALANTSLVQTVFGTAQEVDLTKVLTPKGIFANPLGGTLCSFYEYVTKTVLPIGSQQTLTQKQIDDNNFVDAVGSMYRLKPLGNLGGANSLHTLLSETTYTGFKAKLSNADLASTFGLGGAAGTPVVKFDKNQLGFDLTDSDFVYKALTTGNSVVTSITLKPVEFSTKDRFSGVPETIFDTLNGLVETLDNTGRTKPVIVWTAYDQDGQPVTIVETPRLAIKENGDNDYQLSNQTIRFVLEQSTDVNGKVKVVLYSTPNGLSGNKVVTTTDDPADTNKKITTTEYTMGGVNKKILLGELASVKTQLAANGKNATNAPTALEQEVTQWKAVLAANPNSKDAKAGLAKAEEALEQERAAAVQYGAFVAAIQEWLKNPSPATYKAMIDAQDIYNKAINPTPVVVVTGSDAVKAVFNTPTQALVDALTAVKTQEDLVAFATANLDALKAATAEEFVTTYMAANPSIKSKADLEAQAKAKAEAEAKAAAEAKKLADEKAAADLLKRAQEGDKGAQAELEAKAAAEAKKLADEKAAAAAKAAADALKNSGKTPTTSGNTPETTDKDAVAKKVEDLTAYKGKQPVEQVERNSVGNYILTFKDGTTLTVRAKTQG